ncbi:MAG TPA: hypothetical protein VMZ30_22270 [Pyrinomonadaceae bacterium]|nr:hypothetical protein [Pyrinomonadaceae bacterium]
MLPDKNDRDFPLVQRELDTVRSLIALANASEGATKNQFINRAHSECKSLREVLAAEDVAITDQERLVLLAELDELEARVPKADS